eukprot:scaffold16298_cov19-Tisochrysis_lutea.AAC.1
MAPSQHSPDHSSILLFVPYMQHKPSSQASGLTSHAAWAFMKGTRLHPTCSEGHNLGQPHLVCSMVLVPRQQEGKARVGGFTLPHCGFKARATALGKHSLHVHTYKHNTMLCIHSSKFIALCAWQANASTRLQNRFQSPGSAPGAAASAAASVAALAASPAARENA